MFHKAFHRNVNILPLYAYLGGKKNAKCQNCGIHDFEHSYSLLPNLTYLKEAWSQILGAQSLASELQNMKIPVFPWNAVVSMRKRISDENLHKLFDPVSPFASQRCLCLHISYLKTSQAETALYQLVFFFFNYFVLAGHWRVKE